MIREFTEHLQKSPEAGTAISIWRDDDALPFSDLASTPILLRQQPGTVDRDIGFVNYDLWLFSQGNATLQQAGQVEARLKALQDWLIINRNYTGRMFSVGITGGVSGPVKDGQGRWGYSISIQVRRGLG